MARLGVAYNDMNDVKIYVYELTDHLGNVRAVFTKNGADNHQVEGYTDYYPFGMPMPNRTLNGAEGYRYGYQGQFAEEDDETGLNAFQLRMYDPRIMRWLSPDPYGQYGSPYVGMGNDPINRIDPDGGFDWYKDADGNYAYDSRITSQQDLTTYGIEGTYIGETFYDFDALQTGDAQGNLFSLSNGNLIASHLDGVEVGPIKYLDIYRDTQTLNSTTSTFTFEDISGFILEPKGPETAMANQNRRIPAGVYNLVNHNSKKYPNVFKLYNDQVSQSRAILIHKGNKPDHTRGCLLPGCARSTDRVWKSGDKLVELKNALEAENIENIRVRIHNKFPHRGIPFLD